jgi:uncharacterized protein (DUF1697 family)
LAAATSTYVILLRAIGPVTHKLMSMDAWREASTAAGFGNPQTLVATGNMVADFAGTASAATKSMTAVLRGFGLKENVIPVVRKPGLLKQLVADDIFAGAEGRASQTAIFFFVSKHPDFGWIGNEDGPAGLKVVDDHLLIDFGREANEAGALLRRIDKYCGTSTARNLNTVQGLVRLCANRGKTA